MTEVYLTKEGMDEKKKRLEHLKAVTRHEVAEKIKIAREFGDLSENSEYDAARRDQELVESEIAMLEEKLRIAKVIDPSKRKKGEVSIGSKVKVFDMEFKEELEYLLVGSLESKPEENIISNHSPIGEAIFGKKVGDIVAVKTPSGSFNIKILEIK